MKQTMLWMLGLCMAILPTGRLHAAEFAETTETTESTDPAVCDTIFMTWMAEAGVEKPLLIGVEASESWNGSRTFWVNFGDGSYLYSSAVDTAFTKTYTEAGSYNVTITVSQPEVRITKFNCFDYNAGTDNGVTGLDVSGCTALKVLGCSNNRLTSLYVGTCTALTQLGCNDNPLSSLDVSRNTVLTTLHCANTQLTSLDVTRNTALVKLQCSYNGLTSLDVSQNTALMWLECYNTQLTSLDVSRNPALKELQCFDNSRVVDLGVDNGFDLSTLPGMDVSRIGGVTGGRLEGSRLIFEANEVSYYYKTHFQGEVALALDSVWFKLVASVPLTPVDPDEPTDPTDAVCDTIFMTWTAEAGEEKSFRFSGTEGGRFIVNWGDGADTVVIGKGRDVYYVGYDHDLQHSYAETGSYDVTIAVNEPEKRIITFDCHHSETIIVSNNNVTSLDVRYCTALRGLSCGDNQLSSLDISRNVALVQLSCLDNQLTSLDVSQASALKWLICGGNQLAWLDVSQNKVLDWLCCENNRLDTLDISQNTALTHLECDGNRLASLDVSQNTALNWLFCEENQLMTLDVSRNTALTYLNCSGNWLTSLDVSRNTALWNLNCGENQLGSLDVSCNTDLKHLECGGNRLASLDVSQNTALTGLRCFANQLTSLDISRNTALECLDCGGNRLASLDVSQNTALTELICFYNQLTSLDVSANSALTELLCSDNSRIVDLDTVNSFDLSTLPGMDVSRIGVVIGGRLEGSRLIFETDRVTYQYVTHFPGEASWGFDSVEFTLVASAPLTPTEPAFCDTIFMTWTAEAGEEKPLQVGVNGKRADGLYAFNVDFGDGTCLDYVGMWSDTSFTKTYAEAGRYNVTITTTVPAMRITRFNCSDYNTGSDNHVTSLDVSGCAALVSLDCNRNQLTSLDVSGCTALEVLYCNNNQLTGLDVSQNTAIVALLCANNQLASLVVSRNTALVYLSCANNQLTSLDVSQNIALRELSCADNGLTGLNVNANVALTKLWCEGNLLSSLDVSGCERLTDLYCENNRLTSLDVSRNADLRALYCYNNRLTSLDLSSNTVDELICHNNQLSVLSVSDTAYIGYMFCDSNALSLSTLVALQIPDTAFDTAEYAYGHCLSPQNIAVELETGRVLDLRGEMRLGNTETDYTVQKDGEPLSDTAFYTMTAGGINGRLRFKAPGLYRLQLSNAAVTENYCHDSLLIESGAYEKPQPVHVYYHITVTGDPIEPTDPTVPDTLVPENGAGWIWMASAGEEKEIEFKGTGKGFRVDWGDGNVSEAKGGAAPDVALAGGADGAASKGGSDGAATMACGADGDLTASASKDSEKELKHRYAAEGIYTVQLTPLSQNGRLTDLEVSDERVLSLAFGDASMLETLDCSDNLLTELALPEAAKLKDLDCSENLLTALDLSGCAALQEADFSDNRLTAVALPAHASLKDVEGEDNRLRLSTIYGLLSQRVKNASYEFDPQSDSVTVTENAVFDLVSEMTIAGRATTYTLLDAATRRPVTSHDYAAEGGMFRFSKPGARYLLTLENANVTDYEKGRADDMVAFTYYIYVSGVANEDLDASASAPWAYVQGRTIYLRSDAPGGAELGEVEAFTAVGQRVYRGHDRAFSVPTAGVYVLRAADGRRCKVMVR